MKTIIIGVLFAFSSSFIWAQQNTVTAFGNANNSSGNISFSVGQIDFIQLTNTTNAGVQQSYYNAISLPVNGLVLTATKQTKQVLLKWETVMEANSSHFIIQRSTLNSPVFDSIGIVGANGSSNTISKYLLLDNTPVAGMNYYRLKQVDKNGRFIYSAIVAVDFKTEVTISCYPNPTSSVIKIDFGITAIQGYSYQLFDANGKLLQTAFIKNSITSVNMEILKAGVYVLKILKNQTIETTIVILKN